MLSTPGARIVAGCTAVPPRSLLRDESGPLIDLSGLAAASNKLNVTGIAFLSVR